MQARAMRITASVGFWMTASGTFSTRTSCAFGMTVARMLFGSFQILLVGDVLHPRHRRAVQRFLNRDVGHRGGRRGAVPMLVLGRAPENVAGREFLDRTALDLGPADAFSDDQGLPKRMRVPSRACPRLEVHDRTADAGRVLPLELASDGDCAGEI